MSGSWGFINLGKEAQNIDIAEPLEPYSGVRIIVGVDDDYNELIYFAGNESGRVLEVENPFGSQAMANAILESVRGYSYQPLYADAALLNPAAEIGDAVSVNGVYSGIYTRATTFGTLMASDISAPTNEEVIHEFNIPTPEERKFQRLNYDIQSEFNTTASEISAKVSKTSPQGQTSFGWSLQDNQWRVFNQSGNILKATASGLEVTGKIQADEGYIGGENGFVIKASAIYNGITELNGQGDRGVYLGTDGLQIGQGFIADSYGNVKASNMRLIGGSIEIGVEPPVIDPIIKDNFTFYNWKFEQQSFTEPYFVINEDGYSVTVERATIDGNISVPSSAYTVSGGRITLNSSWLSSQTLGNHTFEFVGKCSNGAFDWDYDITSPVLQIVEEVQRTYFRVDSSGNVTASSLNITGGTISIGNNFFVDSEGNLSANNGYFRGHVSAGNIDWGGDDGYFNGGGLVDGSVWGGDGGAIASGTIDTDNLVAAVNSSLWNGDYAFSNITDSDYGSITTNYIGTGGLTVVGNHITVRGATCGVVNLTINGTPYHILGGYGYA